MSNEIVVTTVSLPKDLHARARAIAKRNRTTTVHLIRESLTEKIEYLEAKRRVEEERIIAERQRAAFSTHVRGRPPRLPLAPEPPPPLKSEIVDENVENLEAEARTAHVYETQAKLILETLEGSPLERRLRVAEAVAAVKRERPLTHPPDDEILQTLEREVLHLRRNTEKTKLATANNNSFQIIDPNRVHSRGDVDDGSNSKT